MEKDENVSVGNVPKRKNKKVLTLFIALFPSLLLAGDYGVPFAVNLALKGALIFYQFVVIKNILDDYYSYVE